MLKQILQFTIVQFKEFVREPGILFWSLAFPVAMAWGLGIAFTQPAESAHNIAIADAHTPVIDSFLHIAESLPNRKYSIVLGDTVVGRATYHFSQTTWDDAIVMVKRGKTSLILREENGKIQYHYDPRNSDAQVSYLQLSGAIENKNATANTSQISVLSAAGTRYIDFFVPGLMAMNIMMSAMWGISYTLIERRNKKLLRRMVATPMSKSAYMISQFVSRLIISFVEAAVLLGFSWWYFDTQITGSVWAFLTVYIGGNVAFVGIAILVSSRTSNVIVGNGLINAVVMPMMIASGIFFSYHNFPDTLANIIGMLPLTMLADSIRSIFIEGAGFAQVWLPTLVLYALGTICFAVGIRVYKWY